MIVQRLCGICPVSHHLAAAKAMDRIVGGERLTPTAEKMRRLMHYGQIFQSHALHFFHLSSPDLLFGTDGTAASGFEAPVEKRHVLAVAAEHPAARDAGRDDAPLRAGSDPRDGGEEDPRDGRHPRRREQEPHDCRARSPARRDRPDAGVVARRARHREVVHDGSPRRADSLRLVRLEPPVDRPRRRRRDGPVRRRAPGHRQGRPADRGRHRLPALPRDHQRGSAAVVVHEVPVPEVARARARVVSRRRAGAPEHLFQHPDARGRGGAHRLPRRSRRDARTTSRCATTGRG